MTDSGILLVMVLHPVLLIKKLTARDFLGILATRNSRVGFIAMLFVVGGQFATYTYITPFLNQVTGFSGETISSLLLGYTVIGLPGTFLGGAATSRSPKLALAALILLFIASVLALPMIGHIPPVVVAVLAAWGVAYGAIST